MATVKTIKPAGGGDFTTLASWEDFADGQSAADQHAECYTGGNLGAVTLNGWTATPSASAFPKIYVADGEGHFGDVTAGAYISAATPFVSHLDYTQVHGLRAASTNDSNVVLNFTGTSNAQNSRADNCLIHGDFGIGISIGQSGSGVTSSNYVTNNLILIDGTANTSPIGIYVFATDASSGTTNAYVYNNTIYVVNQGSLNNYGIRFANVASCTLNISVENNIVIGAVTGGGASITYCYNQVTFNTGTKTFNNNISSDSTADDFGGSSHLVNKTASQIFEDVSSNVYSLSSSSIALDAGKTLSAVTDDIVGVSRPQNLIYDIGAFETKVADVIVYGVPKSFQIPGSVISSHEYIVDSLIEGPTGQVCQLIYPVTKNSVCPNCIYSPRQKRSSNIYKTGGPVPFENHTTCPWCGGEGRSSREVKEEMRLRVYWTQKDWSVFGPVENPESSVMIIGYMYNLPKIEKCDRILLNKNLSPYRKWICERSGEAVPWGLSQDRYFAQMLNRVGGG